MEEAVKNKIIIVLSLSTLVFFAGTVSSCSSAREQKRIKEKEMLTRLDMEEKAHNLNQQSARFKEQLDEVSAKLEEEKTAHAATQKSLTQEQLINKSLQTELKKLTTLKEALEEDLKQAMMNSSTPAKSKK